MVVIATAGAAGVAAAGAGSAAAGGTTTVGAMPTATGARCAGTGVGSATGIGCGVPGAVPVAGFAAREGSTNDAVVSASESLLWITATAPTPTNRPAATSAIIHADAGRPATL